MLCEKLVAREPVVDRQHKSAVQLRRQHVDPTARGEVYLRSIASGPLRQRKIDNIAFHQLEPVGEIHRELTPANGVRSDQLNRECIDQLIREKDTLEWLELRKRS